MDVLDEEGRLFGVINIIDALVILSVVAVVIAGVVFVTGGAFGPDDEQTTYATVDLGPQSDVLVDELNEGDTYFPRGEDAVDALTITDIHLTPAEDETRVIVRVELTGTTEEISRDGEVIDEVFQYVGAPPRVGRELPIETDRYEVTGTVQHVGPSPELQRTTTALVIEDTIPTTDAAAIAPGDEIRVGDRPAATVESVTTYATATSDQTRVFVGLSVETLAYGDRLRYGETPIQRGAELSFRTDGYELDGSIVRTDTVEEPGTAATRTVTLELTELHEDRLEWLEVGMTETTAGSQIAELTAVEATPTTVILESDDGDLRVHEHPFNRDVRLQAELSVRETPTGLRFKGETLQQGDTITLDLGTTTIQPTVERIN